MNIQLPALTGLRFILAALVLADHLIVGAHPPEATRGLVMLVGSSMVPVFFCLSGFVLTLTYGNQRMSLARFWRARVARLVPAYLLSVVLVIVVNRARVPSEWGAFLANLFLLQAWLPYPNLHDWNGPAWSLSCELFYYALFPALLLVVNRCRPALALALALNVVVFGILVIHSIYGAFDKWPWHPVIGLGTFVLGMVLARGYLAGWRLPVVFGWGVVALWPIVTFFIGYFVLYWAVIAVLSGVMVLSVASLRDGWLLESSSAVQLGNASYSLYILHVPILALVVGDLNLVVLPWWAILPLAIALVGLSLAVYRWIERPARSWLFCARPATVHEPRPVVAS